MSEVIACRMAGGSGCPEVDGGPHYFAYIDPSRDVRICIDCGEPEQEEIA